MTNITTSEYLQRQLIDMIELAKFSGTNAVEFVQSQAPDVVREIIRWEIASGIVLAAICAISSVGLWKLAVGLVKAAKDSDDYEIEAGCHIGAIFSGVLSLCCAVAVLVNAYSAEKPMVTPKLFLIEYTAGLVKGK